MGWPRGSARNSGVTCIANEATRLFGRTCERRQHLRSKYLIALSLIALRALPEPVRHRYTGFVPR